MVSWLEILVVCSASYHQLNFPQGSDWLCEIKHEHRKRTSLKYHREKNMTWSFSVIMFNLLTAKYLHWWAFYSVTSQVFVKGGLVLNRCFSSMCHSMREGSSYNQWLLLLLGRNPTLGSGGSDAPKSWMCVSLAVWPGPVTPALWASELYLIK